MIEAAVRCPVIVIEIKGISRFAVGIRLLVEGDIPSRSS
jgi:hypothetical protein